MKRNDQIASLADARFDRELRDRLSGNKKYNTFDLEELPKHVHLQVLTDPLLRDVKTVVLYADEKRRQMEDYRAFRRNRNEWMQFVIVLTITIGCTWLFAVSWLINFIALGPQGVTLAIKTVRKY